MARQVDQVSVLYRKGLRSNHEKSREGWHTPWPERIDFDKQKETGRFCNF